MTLLRVTYRLRAHHTAVFEKIFDEEIVPIVRRHGVRFLGVWRTAVGEVGEYMELWQFESMADFDRRWKSVLADPQLQKIFERTGPMVESENFTLLDPIIDRLTP